MKKYILKLNNGFYNNSLGTVDSPELADRLDWEDAKEVYSRLKFGIFKHYVEILEL